MKIEIKEAAPTVGQIIRVQTEVGEIYYTNGAEFEWMILAPLAPIPDTNEGAMVAAADTDYIVDMTNGAPVTLDADNTSYLMPRRALGAWRCTAAGGTLGVQVDE